jgi:hypothetical protein
MKIAMPLRRIAMNSFGEVPVDTTVWNARVRFYPTDNVCEKNTLFTPQLFDPEELKLLAAAIDQNQTGEGPFIFLDIGANVGLYSLFVAGYGGQRTRVIAFEPQPGIVD